MLIKISYKQWLTAFFVVFFVHAGVLLIFLWAKVPQPPSIQQSGRPFSINLALVEQSRQEAANDNLHPTSAQKSLAPVPAESKPLEMLREKKQEQEKVGSPPKKVTAKDQIKPQQIKEPKKEKPKKEVAKTPLSRTEKEKQQTRQHKPVKEKQEAASQGSIAQAAIIKNVNKTDKTASPIAGSETFRSRQAKHDWQQKMIAHLMKYKRYTRMARLKKQQGTVLVYFVMDRQGKVVRSSLIKPGNKKIDASLQKEATSVVQRAEPLPVPPEDMFDGLIEMVVPIVFSLNENGS